MIIVTGTVLALEGALDDVLAIATEHVLRSRSEPGCISHAVYRDTEESLRLQFVERWTDMAALRCILRCLLRGMPCVQWRLCAPSCRR